MALEIKKMKQGMSYSCKEKTIILNVFKYFRTQFPDICVTEIVRRTAKATGCSEKSVFQFRKEEASVEGFKEPSKTKVRRNININSRDIKYDNTVRQSIRNIIYDLKYRNVVPSLNTILKQINSDNQLPNFSLMTLRRLLFDMGFAYEKNGNKSILVEKQDNGYVNKDNVPQKTATNKKSATNSTSYTNVNVNINASDSNVNMNIKDLPQMQHSNHNIVPNHIHPMINEQQGHRLMSVHMPQHENHMMPTMRTAHSMTPMMLNCPELLRPPNMEVRLVKHDMPPWMHPPPSYNMVKQQ